MAVVILSAFGRGSVSAPATQIQAVYDSFRSLSNAGLTHLNFHPDAAIHESFIAWNRHQHADGSLADDSLSFSHIGSNSVIFTQSAKTLVLFGLSRSLASLGANLNESSSHSIRFMDTSLSGQAFAPGTVPVVMWSFTKSTSYPLYTYKGVLTSVTSEGFDLALTYVPGFSWDDYDEDVQVFYIAIGKAPGLLVRPEV